MFARLNTKCGYFNEMQELRNAQFGEFKVFVLQNCFIQRNLIDKKILLKIKNLAAWLIHLRTH